MMQHARFRNSSILCSFALCFPLLLGACEHISKWQEAAITSPNGAASPTPEDVSRELALIDQGDVALAQDKRKELAQRYLVAGEDAKALAVVDDALKRTPEDAALLNISGLLKDRSGNHTEAQEIYRKVLDAASTDASTAEYTRNNLGLSLIVAGDSQGAVSLLAPTVKTVSSPRETRQLLALAYGSLGEDDKAYELGLADLGVDEVAQNLRFYHQFRNPDFKRDILLRPAAE